MVSDANHHPKIHVGTPIYIDIVGKETQTNSEYRLGLQSLGTTSLLRFVETG